MPSFRLHHQFKILIKIECCFSNYILQGKTEFLFEVSPVLGTLVDACHRIRVNSITEQCISAEISIKPINDTAKLPGEYTMVRILTWSIYDIRTTEGQQEYGKLSITVAYIKYEWNIAKFQCTTTLEATLLILF